MIISKCRIGNAEALSGENEQIRFVVAPALGGKIVSVYNKTLQKEFLWSNKNLALEVCFPGSDYESNFWGGIDELLPNDIEETVDGNDYPDHGELWTTPLTYSVENGRIALSGKLERSGLFYQKAMYCKKNSPEIVCEYTIRNESESARHFLWKLHAALAIQEGDQMMSAAGKARVVYPENSPAGAAKEFIWPMWGDRDVSRVPARQQMLDFFYLYENLNGEMHFVSEGARYRFSYFYDQAVFPYQWYFASYGKFRDHYTAILEPASGMPVSINNAKALKQCSALETGQEINTTITIYAGLNTKI